MNAGIRITINIVINNRMKCMMHTLIISNTIMCINIKLYINTTPITTATIHPGVQRALHPEDVLHEVAGRPRHPVADARCTRGCNPRR